jgi:hypothetical protein
VIREAGATSDPVRRQVEAMPRRLSTGNRAPEPPKTRRIVISSAPGKGKELCVTIPLEG